MARDKIFDFRGTSVTSGDFRSPSVQRRVPSRRVAAAFQSLDAVGTAQLQAQGISAATQAANDRGVGAQNVGEAFVTPEPTAVLDAAGIVLNTPLDGSYGFLVDKSFIKSTLRPDGAFIAEAIRARAILLFQSNPEGLSESGSASWNTHSIIGRAGDLLSYQYSPSRTFSLNLKYFIDAADGDPRGESRAHLLKRVSYIRSTVKPLYGEGGSSTDPPRVYKLFYGELWSGINVVVENYSLNVQDNYPVLQHGVGGNTPMIIDVSLSLKEANTDDELIQLVRSFHRGR